MSVSDFARHFAVLLLDEGASLEQVKNAFRSLSKQWHPDQFAADAERYRQAVERQKRLNESYSIIIRAMQSGVLPSAGATTNGAKRQGSGSPRTQNRPASQVEQAVPKNLADELLVQGKKYENGQGCPKDVDKAIGCYKQSARMGNLSACFRLGCIYMGMNGDASAQKTAAEYFQQAANCGHVASMFNLALLYERGVGVKRDIKKAIEFYREAAARGDQAAKRKLEKFDALRNEPKSSLSGTFSKTRDCYAGETSR